jgi:negative regulator of sigma E activity
MNKIMHPIEPEELMAYLDGELTAARAASAAAHLSECEECQLLVADLRNVSHNLQAWKVESLESAMTPSIATALAKHRPASRSVAPIPWRWSGIFRQRWSTMAWVAGVAAILLVVAVTVPTFTHSSHMGDAIDQRGVVHTLSMPSGAPLNGRQFDRLEQFGKLQAAPPLSSSSPQSSQITVGSNLPASGPMIIRTAALSLITREFDKARVNMEAILRRHGGYVGDLSVNDTTGNGRSLTATLRVPADQLDAMLTELKTMGRVDSESQSGQDVTSQYVDLQARLSNARNTEARLTDLLRNRTGKLSDVLQVERELDRVRGEIEQMEAERKNMAKQVSFATLNATITEEYKAQLQVVPPSTSTRLGNAAVEGYRSMVDGVVSLVLFLLSTGPSLLLWGAILFFPARMVWKKVRSVSAS